MHLGHWAKFLRLDGDHNAEFQWGSFISTITKHSDENTSEVYFLELSLIFSSVIMSFVDPCRLQEASEEYLVLPKLLHDLVYVLPADPSSRKPQF